MPAIETTNTTHRDFRVHTVETADALDGAWTLQPHVYCDRLSLVAGGVDQATLSYHFGRMIQPGEVAQALHGLLSLRRKFVRVTIDQGLSDEEDEMGERIPNDKVVWYGFVVGEDQRRFGAQINPVDGARELAGDVQVFAAAGLAWFLDRTQVRTTAIFPGLTIGRSVPFNAAAGQVRQSSLVDRANRLAGGVPNEFADRLDNAQLWTAGDVVRYLLDFHAPQTNTLLPWPIDFTLDSAATIEWFTPTVQADGRTPLAIVNELINPRRGLSWRLDVIQNDDGVPVEARIVPFSFSEASITLPSGAIYPANTRLVDVDFDRAIDIEVAALRFVEGRRYDRVRARGARRGSCFSISSADGTLERDWSAAQQVSYWDAASGTAGYGGLTAEQQAARNDEFRRSELLARVFRYYFIPPEWDGRVGAGTGAGFTDFAFPQLNDAGNIDFFAGEPFWYAGLRLANQTPLLTDQDYTFPQPLDFTPTDAAAEPRPPFVIFRVDTAGNKWQYADQLDNKGADGEEGKFTASYYLRMQEAALGFELKPAGGLPHLAADNDADWPASTVAPSQYAPEVDRLTMIATVFCECDTHVEAVWPAGPIAAADERALEELLIDVGERARLDYLAPRTVFDLADGQPRLAHINGHFLRDDRNLLRDIARVAYTWYREPRAAFALSYKQLTSLFTVGDLITTIGADETVEVVLTPVTGIDYDLVRGITSVRTDFAELDFREFLPL